MDVDAARLAVVDLAAHHRGVGVRLHLEARDAVPVDVAAVEVALRYANIALVPNHMKAFVQNYKKLNHIFFFLDIKIFP